MLERNIEGYNLTEIGGNIWKIQTINGRSFTGTFLEVVLYAVIKLGFNINEIDAAVKVMVELGHDSAHFGMWTRFIFTFNMEKEVYRRAS